MAHSAYIGVYSRRWGIPLIDGGTVRLPRLVGLGRALDIILTGRKVTAEECCRIGACEHVAPDGQARSVAEQLANDISRFPQGWVRSDRMSVYRQHGLPVRKALETEWQTSIGIVTAEGISGAGRFNAGKGRHGDYVDIHSRLSCWRTASRSHISHERVSSRPDTCPSPWSCHHPTADP